jgi:hypothetical protein
VLEQGLATVDEVTRALALAVQSLEERELAAAGNELPSGA